MSKEQTYLGNTSRKHKTDKLISDKRFTPPMLTARNFGKQFLKLHTAALNQISTPTGYVN
jgi:hypothetical protein